MAAACNSCPPARVPCEESDENEATEGRALVFGCDDSSADQVQEDTEGCTGVEVRAPVVCCDDCRLAMDDLRVEKDSL